jgi:hypothetical protein
MINKQILTTIYFMIYFLTNKNENKIILKTNNTMHNKL